MQGADFQIVEIIDAAGPADQFCMPVAAQGIMDLILHIYGPFPVHYNDRNQPMVLIGFHQFAQNRNRYIVITQNDCMTSFQDTGFTLRERLHLLFY